MEVFAFHEELVAQHERFSRNFSDIRADDVVREVNAAPGVLNPRDQKLLRPVFGQSENLSRHCSLVRN